MTKSTDDNKRIAMDYLNKQIEEKIKTIKNTESCLEKDPMFSKRNYLALINNTCLDIIVLFDALYDSCFIDVNFYKEDTPIYKCFEWGFRRSIVDKQKSCKIACDNIDKDYTPIEDLGLSVRACNALNCNNILSLNELLNCSEVDLCKLPNLGKRSVTEIKDMLKSRELKLSPVTRAKI
jgi:hypothetical protein